MWIGDTEQEKEAARLKLDARRVLRYVVMVGEYAESPQAESVANTLTENGLTAKSAPFVDGQSKTFRVYIPDISHQGSCRGDSPQFDQDWILSRSKADEIV